MTVATSDGAEGSAAWKSRPRDLPIETVSSFTPADYRAIQEGTMSSACGEPITADQCIEVAMAEAPLELIRGRTLVYGTDAQAADHALRRFYSAVPGMHRVIMSAHARVLTRGGGWSQPGSLERRTKTRMTSSKVPDPSAWELNWHTTEEVWKCLLKDEYVAKPDLDAFADNNNRRCTEFISKWVMPGAMAVDARLHGSLMGGVNSATGNKYMVHMNPPWGMWPEVVQMIRRFRINCVMIYPVFRGRDSQRLSSCQSARDPWTCRKGDTCSKQGREYPRRTWARPGSSRARR